MFQIISILAKNKNMTLATTRIARTNSYTDNVVDPNVCPLP